jgi:4-amino-4-deoxy-L-arabinose transferase-like glycosyltransferase
LTGTPTRRGLTNTPTCGGSTAAIIASLLLGTAFLGATLTWLLLDRSPPAWDDGYYLTRSLELYDTLADQGVGAFAKKFLTLMRHRPPLIAALPTPVYLALGRRYRAAYAVNVLFLAVMFGAIYGIAKAYAGHRAGLIAVAVSGTMPLIYGLSHWYLTECGLIALVCAAIYLMTGWSQSSGAVRACVLGIVFGLGLLMKASFPLYVLIPFGYLMMRWRKSLSAFLLVSALLAAPWYLVNAGEVLKNVMKAGSAETGQLYATGGVLSASAIGHYLSNLANAAPWLYVAALPLLALMGASSLAGPTRRGLALALLWMSPLVFLALGHYRDIRYAAPLYPAAALLFALLADAAIRSRGMIAAAGISAVLGLGCLSMAQNSFGVPGKRLELGGLLLQAPRLSYARKFDPVAWPQREILADLYRVSKFNGGDRRTVLLGTNSVRFNADNFTLAAVAGRLPLGIGTTAFIRDPNEVAEAVNGASYFVYKEGGERDEQNFNTVREIAVKQARDGGRFTELLSRALPDGSIAHVLTNTTPGKRAVGAFLHAGLDEIPTCKVTFADRLQLTGIGVSRSRQGLEVKYRWRAIQPMDRDYWCFTHVVDQKGNVIGYLDHPILNGDPPTSLWKAGDVAVESLVFPLPENDRGAYRLRVGVFHRESGERLPITESTFPVIQNHTAAIIDPGGQAPRSP